MSALADARHCADQLVEALTQAEAELPDYAVEPLRFARAEAKVLRRRVENLRRALGEPEPNIPPAA